VKQAALVMACLLSACGPEQLAEPGFNLELILQAGERIGVVGKNGAGKTTLVRTILGETPPDAGEVACEGEIVTAKELGMGVSFIGLSAADKARIEALIEKLAAKLPKVR